LITHHEHCKRFAEDEVKEILSGAGGNHEKIADKEKFTATVVEESIMQTPEEAFEWILNTTTKNTFKI